MMNWLVKRDIQQYPKVSTEPDKRHVVLVQGYNARENDVTLACDEKREITHKLEEENNKESSKSDLKQEQKRMEHDNWMENHLKDTRKRRSNLKSRQSKDNFAPDSLDDHPKDSKDETKDNLTVKSHTISNSILISKETSTELKPNKTKTSPKNNSSPSKVDLKFLNKQRIMKKAKPFKNSKTNLIQSPSSNSAKKVTPPSDQKTIDQYFNGQS